MSERPSDRLIRRLRAENGLQVPVGTYVARTHAGRHQKAAGAWTWLLHGPDGRALMPAVGSQWPVRDLLRFPHLSVSVDHAGFWSEQTADRHVDPDATGEEIRKILSPGTTQRASRMRE